MKNFKLILRSLISNNACIDGGRFKKWFVAIIMFFLSVCIALIPSTVKAAKSHGDDAFANYSFGAREAFTEFSEELNKHDEWSLKVAVDEASGENRLVVNGFDRYDHKNKTKDVVDYKFAYFPAYTAEYCNEFIGDGKTSYMIFTPTQVVMHIVNPESESKDKITDIVCGKAYKYLDEGYDLKSNLVSSESATEQLNGTWDNWKSFIRDAYNANRLTGLWQNALVMGSIDIVIVALMGFMIWILTRGKNNPYRLFKIWECQKISYWTAITPAILACAFGFLFENFAQVLFPLLIGVRVMWLTMKSLRPDGSGYAAN